MPRLKVIKRPSIIKQNTGEGIKPRITTICPKQNIETEVTEKKDETITDKYLSTLNEHEKQTLSIARDHLGQSFCLERSVGFVSYQNQI